jgi:hypothetical protein
MVGKGGNAPHQCRINAPLTIAKALPAIRKLEGALQGRVKVDGTFV